MKKLWIKLWSLWQKFHQSFHESDKTLDWNYKLQLFMKMKRFNLDQCGKNFAKGCNLKVLIQNVHEIYSWIKLWTLQQIFHQSIQFVENLSLRLMKLQMWILWKILHCIREYEDTCQDTPLRTKKLQMWFLWKILTHQENS